MARGMLTTEERGGGIEGDCTGEQGGSFFLAKEQGELFFFYLLRALISLVTALPSNAALGPLKEEVGVVGKYNKQVKR